jgi:hypothetical protein
MGLAESNEVPCASGSARVVRRARFVISSHVYVRSEALRCTSRIAPPPALPRVAAEAPLSKQMSSRFNERSIVKRAHPEGPGDRFTCGRHGWWHPQCVAAELVCSIRSQMWRAVCHLDHD